MGDRGSDFKREESQSKREVKRMACFLVPLALAIVTSVLRKRIPEGCRINVLSLLLWGGVMALALEHVWHGEVLLYPPFLTAGLSEILPEMLMVGVPMTIVPIGMWASITVVTKAIHGGAFRPSRLGIIRETKTGK